MFKQRKVLSLFMVLVMLISMFTGLEISSFADDDILNYIKYEINDGEVTITQSDVSISGDIVIPETIEGYPVTRIQYGAFDYREGITSITISSHITYVNNIASGSPNINAFYVDSNNEYYSSDEHGVL